MQLGGPEYIETVHSYTPPQLWLNVINGGLILHKYQDYAFVWKITMETT